MTSLWEPMCRGQEGRLEGGGSDFRIRVGYMKYSCESQADVHHLTPLAANADIRLQAQNKYLNPCSV